jgi:hypothetical protein
MTLNRSPATFHFSRTGLSPMTPRGSFERSRTKYVHTPRASSLRMTSPTDFQAQSVADQAKQSDTKGIKHHVLELIPQKYLPFSSDGTTSLNAHQCVKVKNPGATKAWRGWCNPITARLLCPVDYIAQFKVDPEGCADASPLGIFTDIVSFSTRNKLSNGELTLVDRTGDPKFPAFLYDEDTMDGSLAEGFLHGPFLLAVSLRHPQKRKHFSLPTPRSTPSYFYLLQRLLAQKHPRSEGMQGYMVWRGLFPQQSAMPQYTFAPFRNSTFASDVLPLSRHT